MEMGEKVEYCGQLLRAYEKLKSSSLPIYSCGSPATEAIVCEIESIMGYGMPDAVREFMKMFGKLDVGSVVPGFVKEDMIEHYSSIIRTQRDAAEFGYARDRYLVVYRDDIEKGALLCDGTPNPPVVRIFPCHANDIELPVIFASFTDMVSELVDLGIWVRSEVDD
jgi:hypothetical protein